MRHRTASLVVVVALTSALVACTSNASTQSSSDRTLGEPSGPSSADPPSCPTAPEGTVLARTFTSTVTNGVEPLRIYVPPGFEGSPPGTVPLLILLHGAGADETQWIDVGVATAVDCLVADGEIQPLMIVTVAGSRVDGRTDGSPPPMERFVTDEVLPYLRTRYPQLGGRDVTSIGGISRGGGWALRIAAARPDLFSAVGGHSPATDLSDGEIGSLARHNVRIWLDVGNKDRFKPPVARLAAQVRSLGYGVFAMSWDGGHDRRYWSHHVEDYLRFYGRDW